MNSIFVAVYWMMFLSCPIWAHYIIKWVNLIIKKPEYPGYEETGQTREEWEKQKHDRT